MSNQLLTSSIGSYISDLLLDTCEDLPAIPIVDEKKDVHLIDEQFFDTTRDNYTEALSENHQYFSFSIESTEYIVADHSIVTVKALLDRDAICTSTHYDVSTILNQFSRQAKLPAKFILVLKSDYEFGIEIEEIGGLINITAENIVYKSKSNTRPWLAGMSRDFQYVLLNTRLIQKVIQGNQQLFSVGINPAGN